MRSKFRIVLAAAVTAALMAGVALVNVAPTSASSVIKNKVLAHQLAVEMGQAKPYPHEQWVSGGVMDSVYQAAGIYDARLAGLRNGPAGRHVQTPPTQGTQGCHNVYGPGPSRSGVLNVRANQDCGLRRQAEEVVAINPTNPKNLVAGQNDSRVGYNQCGFDYSFDGGVTWGDQLPPFTQYVFPNGHNLDFCSDPGATFDSKGNAYIVGIGLSLDGLDSALLIAKSNAPNGGAFFHSTVPDPFQEYRDVPLGVAASDESETIANDKELLVADASNKSPKKDNVYVTWTRFNFDTGQGVGADSPIYFSQSTDGGATWSTGIEISGSSQTYCTVGSGEQNPNACDQDQGSDPIVGKDGTVYVGFGNGNVPGAGMGQHLVVSCPPTKDCSDPASWTAPGKAGDDFGLQPVSSGTDQTSGCPNGRQCLPPNGYRMDDFVEGSISVTAAGTLFFVWADGRNIGENCQGIYQNAQPPCNNDVFYSYSMDGGKTFSSTYNLTADPTKFGDSAQWMPWGAVTPDGQTLWVAFYDRHHRNCEFSGCNDITLLKVTNAATSEPTVVPQRITTSSMPNLVVANNPVQAGFLGDYMWVAVAGNGSAPYIVWADTRGLGGAVEEDLYFAR